MKVTAFLSAVIAVILIALIPSKSSDLVVFAAASTLSPLQDICTAFEEETHLKITINAASSAILARQIVAGAPAHVFISANKKWFDFVKSQTPLKESSSALLSNRLAIVTTSAYQNAIYFDPEKCQLDFPKKMVLADPGHVPLGMYSQEALINLGLWEKLQNKLVFASDARHAVTLLKNESVSCGIIYANELTPDSQLVLISLISEKLHQPITYFAGYFDHPRVRSFVDYLYSSKAQEIFSQYGFSLP